MIPQTQAAGTATHGPLFGATVDDAAPLRLFCLPFAGGGASMYYPWRAAAPEGVRIYPLHLAGREQRFREPARSSMAEVVGELADALGTCTSQPFVLFGHSLGAIIAFELARELRRRHGVTPAHLFVAASRAPQLRTRAPRLGALPDAEFVDMVQQRYGGIPDAILSNPELRSLFVPVLKADLTVLETYRYADEDRLPCPLTAVAGREDHTVALEEMSAWSIHTSGAFDLRVLPGDHFFRERRHDLLRAITPSLADLVARSAGLDRIGRTA